MINRQRAGGCETAAHIQITAVDGRAGTKSFLLAGPTGDAVNLASISLRLGGRRLLWDSAGVKIMNVPQANRCLTREYRLGWKM
jgi:hypothetical protein